MAGDIETQLDVPYARQPEVRAKAAANMRLFGAGDLLEMLGLDETDSGPLIIDGRIACPACGTAYRDDGRRSCRKPSCKLGPDSRRVKR